MTKLFVFLLSVLVFNACDMTQEPATEEQKKNALKNAVFNKDVISNLKRYEDLKVFLEEYKDTIIKYKNTKNKVTFIRGGGLPDSIYFQHRHCYTLQKSSQVDDIEIVPAFLKQQLSKIWNSIGDSNLQDCYICYGKNVGFILGVKGTRGINGLCIDHDLIWGSDPSLYRYDYYKDSVISKNWVYRIGVLQGSQGW